MIRSVTPRGFVFDARPAPAVGDAVAVDLGAAGRRVATVIAVAEGEIRCAFVSPLVPAELAAARTAGRVIRGDANELARSRSARWPRPLRAVVAVGGALALWGLVAFAIG